MEVKKIKIIYDEKGDCVNIDSNDFDITYINGYGGYGMQCQYSGEHEKYEEILKQLNNIANSIREIEKLTKV